MKTNFQIQIYTEKRGIMQKLGYEKNPENKANQTEKEIDSECKCTSTS